MNHFSKKNILEVQQIFKENNVSDIKYKKSYNDFFQLNIKQKICNVQTGGDYLVNI
jgi:hypothetical protein